MATTEEAIGGVRDVLAESDQDLYVYAPEGQDFLIGEVVLTGAASFLLGAFFKGAKAVAEKQIEEWGKDVATWILERIRGLFGSERAEDAEKEAEVAAVEAKKALQASPGALSQDSTAKIESAIHSALVENKVPPERADAIVRAVSAQGVLVLEG